MIAFLKSVNQRLRGLRTYIVAVVMIFIGALNAADLIPLFPPDIQPWANAFVPAVFIVLRYVTTTPPAGRQ